MEFEAFTSGCENQERVAALTEELMEYQVVKAKVDALKVRLAEFNTAIEDFNLACAQNLAQDQREILCSAQSYRPLALVQEAGQVAQQLEYCTEEMEAAKGRVLCKILTESENVAQYNAVRYVFIDFPACMRGEQPIPDYVYHQ